MKTNFLCTSVGIFDHCIVQRYHGSTHITRVESVTRQGKKTQDNTTQQTRQDTTRKINTKQDWTIQHNKARQNTPTRDNKEKKKGKKVRCTSVFDLNDVCKKIIDRSCRFFCHFWHTYASTVLVTYLAQYSLFPYPAQFGHVPHPIQSQRTFQPRPRGWMLVF